MCRTDLHVVDGELPNPKLPLIIGHEIVGRVTRLGDRRQPLSVGQRVGVPWLGWTDGECSYCRAGQENLCVNARFTGYTSTAATPNSPWPTSGTASRFPNRIRTWKLRRCFAPA